MVVSFIAGLLLAAFIALVYVGIPIVIGSFIKDKLEEVVGPTASKVLGIAVAGAIVFIVFQYLPMEYNQPYDR